MLTSALPHFRAQEATLLYEEVNEKSTSATSHCGICALAGWSMRFNVEAEGEVDIESLVDAGVEHREPVRRGFFEFRSGEQEAGLDDNFQGVREVMGKLPDFKREVLRDVLSGGGGAGGTAVFIRGVLHSWSGPFRGDGGGEDDGTTQV